MAIQFQGEKILVLGASVLQIPIIQKAKELGLKVVAVDLNAAAAGRAYCDEFFVVSTTDVTGVAQVVETVRPVGVVTAATDLPIRVIAEVAERFGLPGPSVATSLKATDKALMIEAFRAHKVPCPQYFITHDLAECRAKLADLGLPCILKPVDSSGSRGVVLVSELETLESAFTYSQSVSRSGSVIVEEVLRGNEISVETITLAGQTHVLAITDKETTGSPHYVETAHAQPARLNRKLREQVIQVAQEATTALGITEGPSHIEMMCTPDGPRLIELGHRLGGDFITSHLVPLSTGIDMLAATVLISTGHQPDLRPKFNIASAVRFFSAPEGMLKRVCGLTAARAVPHVYDIVLFKKSGFCPADLSSSSDRVGAVIAQAQTRDQAERACLEAIDQIKYQMEV